MKVYMQLTAVLISLGILSCNTTDSNQFADLVLLDAAVYTVNDKQPWAEAVAIKNGKIIAVGRNDSVSAMIHTNTKILNLAGNMVLPGFHDAHLHALDLDVGEYSCKIVSGSDFDALQEQIKTCQKDLTSPDEWLIGQGFNLTSFPNGTPDKSILDSMTGNRPAVLISESLHNAWANSKALAIAGIDKNTPDPINGIISRDPATGEATGFLQESAKKLVMKMIPPKTTGELAEILMRSIYNMNAYGITSIMDGAVTKEILLAYHQLAKKNELNVRASMALLAEYYGETLPSSEQLATMAKQYRAPNLRTNAVKIFVDGVTDGTTAAVSEPYHGHGHRGQLSLSPEQLSNKVIELDELGMQIKMHAIGDRAVHTALNAYAAARDKNGPSNLRHHIDHLDMVQNNDIPRFSELGILAGIQPLWAAPWDYRTKLAVPLVGEKWFHRFFPFASLQQAGALLTAGSDWQVSSLNPLIGIEIGITREVPGEPERGIMGKKERLSLANMLRIYTLNNAYLLYQENETGSIEVGKAADIVVLDRNLFEIPASEISQAKVELTLFNGKTVYQRTANNKPITK